MATPWHKTKAHAIYQRAKEEETYTKQRQAAVAAKREQDAADFDSQQHYPPLGGKFAQSNMQSQLNFKATVEEAIVKQTVAARLAEDKRLREEETQAHLSYAVRGLERRQKEVLPSLQYTEAAAEDDYSASESGDDEGNDGEFNAHLGVIRRRGDRGVW